VTKLALGIADTYALSSVAELIGRASPTLVVPFVNAALAGRAPSAHAVAALRAEGARVLLGPDDGWQPTRPALDPSSSNPSRGRRRLRLSGVSPPAEYTAGTPVLPWTSDS
jgi:hypothetical protein